MGGTRGHFVAAFGYKQSSFTDTEDLKVENAEEVSRLPEQVSVEKRPSLHPRAQVI